MTACLWAVDSIFKTRLRGNWSLREKLIGLLIQALDLHHFDVVGKLNKIPHNSERSLAI